ncbi:MAG: redoxin domain-containing protein [Anaerolineae bacterium]|jgi:peroxiredoxin|nr:redoxin domain-containing protein [Anaerolineae bacterium]
MMYDAFEHGPKINSIAADFELVDHQGKKQALVPLIGLNGLLLLFTGNIWQPSSVRRLLWLQRHVNRFALLGITAGAIIQDYQSSLRSFQMSSPIPVPFPLMADVDGLIQNAYQMHGQTGLVLIDYERVIRQKWLLPVDYMSPNMDEMLQAVQLTVR